MANMGVTYAQLGEHEKALANSKEALEIQKRIGVPIKDTQKVMGTLYIEMGKTDLAEAVIKETDKYAVHGLLVPGQKR